ncbi:MAG: NTP transferase domain-containing protein [Alphaproteobacteria bacterium]
MQFDGKTLLQRHLEILREKGFDDLTIVVGHRADLIEKQLRELGAEHWVHPALNPDYERSSLLSLWCLREVFSAGEPVFHMDADRALRSPADGLAGRGTGRAACW